MDKKERIDFSSLEKALEQLKKSRDYLGSDMAKNDKDLRQQFRAATIQAFEYTFELAHKMIKRQLEMASVNPTAIDQMDFRTLARTAAEAGLIKDPRSFFVYREKRNITAHTYDADKAEEILSVVDDFIQDVGFIIEELKRRNQ